MKITAISVGKKHKPDLAEAITEYEKRLAGFCEFSWKIIPAAGVDVESAAILRSIKDTDAVVLLDERGQLFSNQQLASYIEKSQNDSVKHVVIIIGGAYGVSNEVASRANIVLALSPLVFPHQIVRLLLVEQLYRTYSLLSGGRYHHS